MNNPLRFIDVNGDSVRLTDAYKNNNQIMKAHNEWLKTDGGKKFMELFGEGGKFENVAVVFDAVDPDKLSCLGADGDNKMEYVDSEGRANNIEYGAVSENVKNAAKGKGNGSYIRATIEVGLYDYSSSFLIFKLVDTDIHEDQHTIITIRSIINQGIKPTSEKQHSLMLNTKGQYYKSRYSSYWQIKNLWATQYMEQRQEYKKDVVKFVNDQVNGFNPY